LKKREKSSILPFNAIQQSLIALAIKGVARMPLNAIRKEIL
jgi:hypothetical protein